MSLAGWKKILNHRWTKNPQEKFEARKEVLDERSDENGLPENYIYIN